MTNEQLKILQDLAGYLRCSTDVILDDLVYRTPPQNLRIEADAIEERDKAIRRFRELLNDLEYKNSK